MSWADLFFEIGAISLDTLGGISCLGYTSTSIELVNRNVGLSPAVLLNPLPLSRILMQLHFV